MVQTAAAAAAAAAADQTTLCVVSGYASNQPNCAGQKGLKEAMGSWWEAWGKGQGVTAPHGTADMQAINQDEQ